MRVETPSPYAGALVTGWARIGGVERRRAAVIVKASYVFVETAANTFDLTPADEPAEIVYADAGETYEVEDDGDMITLFDVRYEADIALQKARADIVVTGWLAPGRQGAVLVDDAVWLTRSGPGSDRDAQRNLFGWQPRDVEPRKLAPPADPDAEPDAGLPADYTPAFNNLHRRGGVFSATGQIAAQLEPGATIEIHQSADHSDASPLRISLTAAPVGARYRTYCGHGPDIPHAWAITALAEPALDTLILSPAERRASVVWRTGFDPDGIDPDALRAVQIIEGRA